MGFKPMASVLALQFSAIGAMETHTLGAGEFFDFIEILTREINET